MTTRFSFALAVLVASAFALGCAQTPPVAKPTKTKTPTVPTNLPPIPTNPKWTVSQNSAQLLLNTGVQADLQLSSETKAALMKVYGDYDAKYTSLTKDATPTDALQAALEQLTADSATKAVALLSSAQQSRLCQLGIQAMELEALRLADVRTKLTLTLDQTAQFDKTFADLDAKQDAWDTELGERMSKLSDPGATATQEQNDTFHKQQKAITDDMEPRSKALEDLRKADLPALLALLTSDQMTTWRSMTGAPLKGS